MAYDYQKVQAWLHDVPRGAPAFLILRIWMACINPQNFALAIDDHRSLVDRFRAASLWEQVNMLHGLKDLVVADLDSSLQVYGRKARGEDELHDPELQRILRERFEKSKTSTQNIPDGSPAFTITLAPSQNCPVCKQPYVHHQHPMKPLGVIISSTCGCKGETDDAQAQEHRRRGGAPPSR